MNREPEPELMLEKEQVIAYDKGDFSVSEDDFVSFISDFLIEYLLFQRSFFFDFAESNTSSLVS